MPCRVELTEAEIEASRRAQTDREIAKVVEPLQKRNDKLTRENDQLRELILKIATEDQIPANIKKEIFRNQREHRKEDLRRLEKALNEKLALLFRKKTVRKEERNRLLDLLYRVENADPNEPLEPQLGFDPDDF